MTTMLLREFAVYGLLVAIVALVIFSAWYYKQPARLLAIPLGAAGFVLFPYLPEPPFPVPRGPYFGIGYALAIFAIVANLMARRRPAIKKKLSLVATTAMVAVLALFIFCHPR